MLTLLLDNLILVGQLFGILGASILLNTLMGLFYNVGALKEVFSWEKLLAGLLKGLIIAIGLGLITLIVSLAPAIVEQTVFADQAKIITEAISMLFIISALVAAIVKYAGQGFRKLYQIAFPKE